MAATFGRVEAQITIPSGGWSFTMSITGLVGTSAQTIPAGTYWPSELVEAFRVALENGEAALLGSAGFSVSTFWGEAEGSSPGRFRLTYDGGVSFAISAWTSTDLRNALGFTATLSGSVAYTPSVQTAGIWRPGTVMAAPRHVNNGHFELDRTLIVSPRGRITALNYSSRQRLGRVMWSHVEAKRAIEAQEVIVGASFERWWLDTHGGRVSYFGSAPLVRLYWDADAGTYVEIRLIEPMNMFVGERPVPEWIGVQTIYIDGYVVPS